MMDSDTENAAAAAEHESVRSKKIKRGKFTLQDYVQDGTMPVPAVLPADKLCEHELSLIFSNSCLSVEDLLNFRLVNKNWRDAATSTLLRNNVCFVALAISVLKKSPTDEHYKGYDTYFHQYADTGRTLAQLTNLISSSIKFPATDFYVNTGKNWAVAFKSDQPDLLSFFKIHGDKIRTLGCRGDVSLQSLLRLLSECTPNIKCLDLRDATLSPLSKRAEETQKKDSKWIPAKLLILGGGNEFYCQSQKMHLLLSSLPNLRRIENVDIASLEHILNEKKAHLIRSFHHTIPRQYSEPIITLLSNFVQQGHPQLFSLGLDVYGSCEATSTLVSAILESSKDTLEQLELFINQFEYHLKLWTFPMINLQSIILKGHYLLDEIVGQVDEDRAFSIFCENGMSASNCFPNLLKLRLVNLNLKENLMRFFRFKLDGDSTTLGLPRVEVLEILNSILPKNGLDSAIFSKFFPNLRVLRMKCHEFKNLKSSFWLLFPSVEFLEIFSIRIRNYNGLGDGEAFNSFADTFFTGFSSDLCRKLRTTELPGILNNAEGLKSLRLNPCVCDLLHLKEMKLKFCELSAEFASHVTGKYAFSQMPDTKFIICYDPENVYCKTGRYEQTWDDFDAEKFCFTSVKPYVEVAYEDWGNWDCE